MRIERYLEAMSTTEAPASPAQQSPSRWQRFRSQLGLCIAWFVLLVLGIALPLYVIGQIVLGRTDLIDAAIRWTYGVTGILIFVGLRALWRRGREAEAADGSGVRSSSATTAGSDQT